MLINEVKTKVGLTKKSIRYYENEGLLKPKRNYLNDYREYTKEDVEALKLIKFLRELDVSITDIKKLQTKELTLKDCLLERINKIEEVEKNYQQIKSMCEEIIKNHDEYQTIDITKYSHTMNILNKKGFTMAKTTKNNNQKIVGAILSSITFSIFFLFFIILFTYLKIKGEGIPFLIYLFLMLIFGLPVLGIIVNLIKRIKEIKGGEEDEASKY